jgi:hypothetical protein
MKPKRIILDSKLDPIDKGWWLWKCTAEFEGREVEGTVQASEDGETIADETFEAEGN